MDFLPKQIAEFKHHHGIAYELFDPPPEFTSDVYYVWRLRNTGSAESFSYPILPDTCIDLIVEEKDGLLACPFVSRPFATVTDVELTGKFNYWGIRFRPGRIMKYLWFELQSIETDFEYIIMHNSSFVSLADFISEFINYSPGNFDNKFLAFDYAPERLLSAKLSAKQKARLFKQLTGFHLNTYKKVQKFQASVGDPYAHFYDQSHYIKTFKQLTGIKPSTFHQNYSV